MNTMILATISLAVSLAQLTPNELWRLDVRMDDGRVVRIYAPEITVLAGYGQWQATATNHEFNEASGFAWVPTVLYRTDEQGRMIWVDEVKVFRFVTVGFKTWDVDEVRVVPPRLQGGPGP